MIDSIVFKRLVNTGGIDLNAVTNGAGIALHSFETDYETRYTDVPRAQGHGNFEFSPYSMGSRTFRLEGDLMDTTPTLYWNRRRNFMAEFRPTSVVTTKEIGSLEIQFPGFPELITSKVRLDGSPDVPINRAGATISPYRLALKSADPVMYGILRSQNFLANAAAAALTGFGGNAHTLPQLSIWGPITNPLIQWAGQTYFSFPGFTLGAGNVITIYVKDRRVYYNLTPPLYSILNNPTGWKGLDPSDANYNMRLTGTGTTGATLLTVQWNNGWLI